MIVEYIQRSKGTMTFLKAFNLKEINLRISNVMLMVHFISSLKQGRDSKNFN